MQIFKVFLFTIIILLLLNACGTNEPSDIKENKKVKSNIFVNPTAGWIKIVKKNKGPSGYSNVYLRETSKYCLLRCENPGFEQEPVLIKSQNNMSTYPYEKMLFAIHYAKKQISNGKLKGRKMMPSLIRVRWKASSKDTNTADLEIVTW